MSTLTNTNDDLSEYLLITALADLFETSGSEDVSFIADKITEGLEKYGLLSCKEEEEEEEDQNFNSIAA